MKPNRRLLQRLARIFIIVLFGLYLLLALNAVFLPISVPEDWPRNITAQATTWTLSRVNLIPFRFGQLFEASPGVIFWELVGNILLTVPFGFVLPFMTRIPARRIPVIALAVGLTLETAQLAFSLLGLRSSYGHTVDINDVLLNGLGVLLGYGLYRSFAWILHSASGRRDQEKGYRHEQVNAE